MGHPEVEGTLSTALVGHTEVEGTLSTILVGHPEVEYPEMGDPSGGTSLCGT